MLPCHIYMVYPDPVPPAISTPADPMTVGQKRVIAAVEVLLCSSLPTQIVIGQLLAAFGLDPRTDSGQLSPPFAFALRDGLEEISIDEFHVRRNQDQHTRAASSATSGAR